MSDALAVSAKARFDLLAELQIDLPKRAVTQALCRQSFVFWCNNFAWTYNPKLVDDKYDGYVPFILFPKQIELAHWLDDRVRLKQEGAVAKSRDIGFTFEVAAYACWRWLYYRGFKTTFGSRVQELVDEIGNPDSIFEKIRIILERLPSWMRPEGYGRKHDNHMRLINPVNGNIISGEAGEQMGRGGRATLYIVDEGAYLENAESVDRAVSANADCRIWASSANGSGNLFHRKCTDGNRPVFWFRWHDDPRKTQEWADAKKKELKSNPGAWEAEYEIDFATSRSNTCIFGHWVESSRRLYKMIKSGEILYSPPEVGIGGLDIGAGKAQSVFLPRYGILVECPDTWQQVDNIQTTYAALDSAHEKSVTKMNYDAPGVGNTVTSTLNHLPDSYSDIEVVPVNTGVPPEEVQMPDKRRADQWFTNLKIQLWWRLRDRFHATHEFMMFLDGDNVNGVSHNIADLIALCECSELETQLAIPLWLKNEKGLLALESKKDLAKRGVASPDYADALALTEISDDIGFAAVAV